MGALENRSCAHDRLRCGRTGTGWEHFPHDADVGVRGWGTTPAEAFEQAALALTAIATNAEVRPQISLEVRCEAPDIELLFVEWLNAIIYEMAVRSMLFGRFAVRIEGNAARGHAVGRARRRCAPRTGLRAQRRHLHRVACRQGAGRHVVGRVRGRRMKGFGPWIPRASPG